MHGSAWSASRHCTDLENAIAYKLQDVVLQYTADMLAIQRLVADLDWCVARERRGSWRRRSALFLACC